ncbi:MAG: signal peptidase I [Phycisphaerae bacterium]
MKRQTERRTAQVDWTARLHRTWREWVKPALVVVVVCCSFRSAVADWNDVPTGSMKPTIVEGDRIFVNKLAYGLRMPFTSWRLIERDGPQRGDIVVFFAPHDGTRMVKRVIGLPGDTIELRNHRVYVNDMAARYQQLDDETMKGIPQATRSGHLLAREMLSGRLHPMMLSVRHSPRQDYGPVQVPPDSYFLLGDNRDNSRDSRWFGSVHRDLIVGRATAVLFSVDSRRYYLPRWERTFRSLP